MATSSRQSSLFGVNDWKAIYQTFRQADFKSYDYETLRKSFIDYLRTYYPETFNDYIESSEFIALLDVMAFMGQGLAFRNDLNARENFIDTAERRDSVIKLANLVSYNPKRNIAGQGYIKVNTIQTTENLTDLNGFNLSNLPVLWNDPVNVNWLEQFNTIINAALINVQRVGRPGNSQTLLGIKTDEYTLAIPPGNLPVIPFTSQVDGINMNFELVSVTSVDEDYVYEIPPAPSGRFNMVYRNDKLGYGSPNTGFFFYFKQGTLTNYDFNLPQQISNQVVEIGNIQGINNTDTWLYQLSADNGNQTLWKEVASVYADAQLQTESSYKKIFSVISRFNDQVAYSFGDGVFSEIPVGPFRSYVRAGNALTYTIDPTEMQGISVTISYISRTGRTESLTIGLELQLPVTTALARESLAEIKLRAPARYYTQNRMVNGEDYNNFPYTLYSSIIKSKAINRSSVGVSKNLDLLDPTGKYSSTNSFANDGALYQDGSNGGIIATVNNVNEIIAVLTDKILLALSDNRAKQYYLQNYPRYNLNQASGDGIVYWNTSTVDTNSITGYFYNQVSGTGQVPIPIGTFSSYNAKYITKGALIKVTAPLGYYFDQNHRLISGIPTTSDITYYWTTVLNVVDDGYNFGEGNFANGTGPVTLNGFVPGGAVITVVIPVFTNVLPDVVIAEAITKMELNQSFSLLFNNALTINQIRWSIDTYNTTGWFVNFLSQGAGRYQISYRSIRYYFGSVADTRFTFENGQVIYDPFTGKVLADYVKVLETNTQPSSNYPLTTPVPVTVIGQTVESDGYVNDFEVQVASIDVNDRTVVTDPDFFTTVTGYVTGSSNIGIYTFFELIQDPVNLSRYQLIPTDDVAYQYPTQSAIEVVKYDYPLGQLFYAYGETDSNGLYNVFYITVQDPTVTTPYYILIAQPQYLMRPGRQGLQFQYRHNSNNTTRIDPATTNIIDLYLVTQAYYTSYTNWLQDTTGTVPEPSRPTINELQQAYGQLDDYKMLTDSLILNSVYFQPLFGTKAEAQLQGTVKVIKALNTSASDSEIRSAILSAMNDYFSINNWNFGDTFYFSELSGYLHTTCGELVSSVVLVPNDPTMSFGDLYEIKSAPYEIFVNGANANDVIVIAALTPAQLQISTNR